MAIKDTHIFLGMDKDSDERTIGPEKVRDALNNRIGTTEKSSDGAAENVKSNTLIPNADLPGPFNKTIGSKEDRLSKSVIYFNFNDSDEHGIYQYFPATDTIKTILRTDFGWDRDKKITGIDLIDGDKLYWTDNVRPRKINIEKARHDKKLKVNLYFYDTTIFKTGTTYTFNSPDFNGVVYTATSNVEGDLEAGVRAFAKAFNLSAAKDFFTATACEQHVEIEAKAEGYQILTFTASNGQVRLVYDNMYEEPFLEEYMDRAKYPHPCEPTVLYEKDEARKINNVQRLTPQFIARYIYDDFEKAVWSPVSMPPVPQEACVEVSSSLYNRIKVDFTTPRLKSDQSMGIIKKVQLAFRTDNNSPFKFITTLDIWDINPTTQTFDFYNDGIYTELALTETTKLFDALPRTTESQAFVEGRLFDGGILEGYDAPCLDAKVTVSYNEPQAEEEDTYDITGSIYIKQIYVGSGKFRNQPIHQDVGGGGAVVYGGMSLSTVTGGRVNNIDTDYFQTFDKDGAGLNGFVVYLAGTDHYGVSKQFIIPSTSATQDGTTGVFDVTDGPQRSALRDEMDNDNVYSTFTIAGVPDGTYIMRVASQFTLQTQLDASRGYQQTSTNVLRCTDHNGADWYEAEVVVSGGNVAVGEIHIADLTNILPLLGSRGVFGYVTADDITNPIPGAGDPELLNEKRIELAEVTLNRPNNAGWDINNVIGTYQTTSRWDDTSGDARCYTDHNGYWYISTARGLTSAAQHINILQINSGQHDITESDFDLFTFSATVDYPRDFETRLVGGIWRSSSALVRQFSRTRLKVEILDSATKPVAGISVVNARGDVQQTDSNGRTNMITYVDTLTYRVLSLTIRADRLYYVSGSKTCKFTFDRTSETYLRTIDSANNNDIDPDNELTWFTMTQVIATLVLGGTTNAMKRGSDAQWYLKYFDELLRSTTWVSLESLKTHINFYTEPDENGNLHPGGSPTLSWQIKHQPPSWAKYWQWGRTKNSQVGGWWQYDAYSVEYVDDAGGTASFNDATKVKINVGSGLAKYREKFPKSSFTFGISTDDGQRIRFIKKSNGTLFPAYYDFRILDDTGPTELLIEKLTDMGEIKKGDTFEIYIPRLDPDTEFVYEMGECFEVGGTGPNTFHKGPTQDQDPNDLAGTPATGTFKTGDAWYRIREMFFDGGSAPRVVDHDSVSDLYPSTIDNIGRADFSNPDLGEILLPTTIRFSNKFIEDSKVNGLSSYEGLNFKPLTNSFGLIRKLILADNVLVALHENSETISMYINETVLRGNRGENIVALSDQVITSDSEYKGSLGTQNPESVFIDEYDHVYFIDRNKGYAVRRSSNGLEIISDVLMRSYFKEMSRDATKTDTPFIYGSHDRDFREAIFTFEDSPVFTGVFDAFIGEFPNPSKSDIVIEDQTGYVWSDKVVICYTDVTGNVFVDQVDVIGTQELDGDGLILSIQNPTVLQRRSFVNKSTVLVYPQGKFIGDTVAFSEIIKAWPTRYSFKPEYYGQVDNVLVSFVAGQLWKHNSSAVPYNNFYGVQYTRDIEIMFGSVNPKEMKDWLYIRLETQGMGDWSAPIISNQEGQLSELLSSDLEDLEGDQMADFLMDKNTPGVDNPITQGDTLKSKALKVIIRDSSLVYSKILLADAHYITSESTNK